MSHLICKVKPEVESDGCWIAEVLNLPGVLAYGTTEKEAVAAAQALAFRILADRIEDPCICS
jgi:predicted RNase H-like HicB family nuclease